MGHDIATLSFLQSKTTRAFTRVETLMARLKAQGLTAYDPLICCTVDGKFTALFRYSKVKDANISPMFIVRLGYMVVG